MTTGKLIKIIILIGVAILLLAFSLMLLVMSAMTHGGSREFEFYAIFAAILGLTSGVIAIRMIYKDGKNDKKT